MQTIVKKIAAEIGVEEIHAANVANLLFEEDCTIPFIARYRKESHGSMDEVKIREIRDRCTYLLDLQATKERYLKVVEEQCNEKPSLKGKFPGLKAKFMACESKQALEDLYLPFKPKRRTRAQIAKEKGLEPLLFKIMEQRSTLKDLESIAKEFITSDEKQSDTSLEKIDKKMIVADAAQALAGASDILAERINETAEIRASIRELSHKTAKLTATLSEGSSRETDKEKKKRIENTPKYQNYFEYQEPMSAAASHRIMAIFRGEKENILRVGIEVDAEKVVDTLTSHVLGFDLESEAGIDPNSAITNKNTTQEVREWLTKVAEDTYRRLISPSIETEFRMSLKRAAEEEAIKVFSTNLENLLLLPPIPDKTVLGIDPGLRTGSKLAIVNETGKVIEHVTVYPTPGKTGTPKSLEAIAITANLIMKHKVECIAIGNGTGSREIDQIVLAAIKSKDLKNVKRAVVNEAGASVYSTDDLAREEFPDLDPTIRSTISIARRLQDPLAELVKIEPRSIGVGQYQHDCNVSKLNKSLKETVESCVNRVGVNINTASYKLLGYVSGISSTLAKNIVSHRDKAGKFPNRQSITKVPGFGPKAFEQSAGFLRVPNSDNVLDNSSVHPERYSIVSNLAKDLETEVSSLIGKASVVNSIRWEKYVTEAVGMPTLKDIASELIKPGRDPREDGARLMFSDEVSCIEDLKPDMKLKGTVTNVTNFGAFVDIGVHQDGLVHISQLSDEFVSDPASAVSVGDVVNVRVMEVDVPRKRISLSCKSTPTTSELNKAGDRATSKSGAAANIGRKPYGKPGASANRGASSPSNGSSYTTQRSPKKKSNNDSQTFTAADLLAKFNAGS